MQLSEHFTFSPKYELSWGKNKYKQLTVQYHKSKEREAALLK
jgi:hypothetical protein